MKRECDPLSSISQHISFHYFPFLFFPFLSFIFFLSVCLAEPQLYKKTEFLENIFKYKSNILLFVHFHCNLHLVADPGEVFNMSSEKIIFIGKK